VLILGNQEGMMAKDFEKARSTGEDYDWALMATSLIELTNLIDCTSMKASELLSTVLLHSSFLAWPVCYVLNQLFDCGNSFAHSLVPSPQFLDFALVTLNFAVGEREGKLCEIEN
jgi:hypothetical protein